MYDGVHVDSIMAGQPQAARNAAVDNFRCGRTWGEYSVGYGKV